MSFKSAFVFTLVPLEQVSLKTKSVVTLVAFEEKPFLVSHQVSLKTKSTLVAFEEKTFLVSPQVSLKTKYLVTLVAFEEGKRF